MRCPTIETLLKCPDRVYSNGTDVASNDFYSTRWNWQETLDSLGLTSKHQKTSHAKRPCGKIKVSITRFTLEVCHVRSFCRCGPPAPPIRVAGSRLPVPRAIPG